MPYNPASIVRSLYERAAERENRAEAFPLHRAEKRKPIPDRWPGAGCVGSRLPEHDEPRWLFGWKGGK